MKCPPVAEQETEPRLSDDARREFTELLETRLVEQNVHRYAERGRTTIRRLNRREYERTVQSLLKISTPLQHLLPDEQSINGFDTVSDGLRFSPLHMARFVEAASEAIQAALRFTAAPQPIQKKFLYTEQEGMLKNAEDEHAVVAITDRAGILFSKAS